MGAILSEQSSMVMHPLDIPFKGSRDYLHSTDMIEAIRAAVASCGVVMEDQRVVIGFRAFARHACTLAFGGPGERLARPDRATAFVQIGEGANQRLGWVVEGAEEVERRIPYDEDSICRQGVITERTIRLGQAVGFRTVEIAVALTKHLHHTLFPEPGKRWMLTKLDLVNPFVESGGAGMEVAITSIQGPVTRSHVVCGPTRGDLYFSQV